MRVRIYADTSAIGGCEDREFRDPSVRLFQVFIRGDARLVLSELTLRELVDAPPSVRAVVARVPPLHVEPLSISPDAEELAAAYIREEAIGQGKRVDALHIALATVARVDVLVSWNFKHIVNLQRIHAYNAVNLKWGYPQLEIRTPREVIGDD